MSSRRCNWKKIAIPSILAALLTVSLLPAPTYTYVVRELSQTMTGLFTFGGGATFSAGTLSINTTGGGTGSLHLDGGIGATDGNKINLEGLSGNTYLQRDADTGFVLVYRDGSLKATITANGVLPGACGSDLWAMELGTVCTDTQGRRISVGPAGPVVLTGSIP